MLIRIAAASLTFAALAASASPAEAAPPKFVGQVVGHKPGEGKSFACFRRVYDEPHLAGHPQQNIRAIDVLAVAYANMDYDLQFRIGIKVRNHPELFTTVAECGHAADAGGGRPAITCGVASAGDPKLRLTLESKSSVMIDLPEGPNLWKPDATRRDDTFNTAFGPDDKRFRLYRTALSECDDQAIDDEEKQLLDRTPR